MNKELKLELIQRNYFHKLLTDKSVEDKMRVFVQAKHIFDLLKKNRTKRKK